MQQLLVEVEHADQIFVEEECAKHGYTLSSFFKKLLDDYRSRPDATEGNDIGEVGEELNPSTEALKSRRGRKAKTI